MVKTVTIAITVTTVTIVIIFTTVNNINIKYQMLLLYFSKANFFTKVLFTVVSGQNKAYMDTISKELKLLSRFIGPGKSWTDARFGVTQFVTPNTHVFRYPGV